MKKERKRKLLKAKLLNYTEAFVNNLSKIHPELKAKFNPDEDEDYLIEDHLDVFVSDITDIQKAYRAEDNGESLERLWNGSFNFGIDNDEI